MRILTVEEHKFLRDTMIQTADFLAERHCPKVSDNGPAMLMARILGVHDRDAAVDLLARMLADIEEFRYEEEARMIGLAREAGETA